MAWSWYQMRGRLLVVGVGEGGAGVIGAHCCPPGVNHCIGVPSNCAGVWPPCTWGTMGIPEGNVTMFPWRVDRVVRIAVRVGIRAQHGRVDRQDVVGGGQPVGPVHLDRLTLLNHGGPPGVGRRVGRGSVAVDRRLDGMTPGILQPQPEVLLDLIGPDLVVGGAVGLMVGW